MKSRFLVIIVVILTLTVLPSFAQVFQKADRKLEIEFVQQPPCPIAIRTKSVNLDPDPDTDKENIVLEIENKSDVGIRAYAMVSGGSRYPTVHTWVYPTVPLQPGKKILRSVWPNRQEHYYFFFDYILFSDGSVCGTNNHRRSVQIDGYLQARNAAILRLREIVDDEPLSAKIIEDLDRKLAPGFFSADKAGPPNEDTIKSMPQRAWDHLVTHLRALKDRGEAVAALTNKLESEKPLAAALIKSK